MIADKIKELRKLHRLTQPELAKLLGVTRSSVNAWEIQDHVIVNFAYITGYSKTEVHLRSGHSFRIARRCFADFEKARNHYVLREADSPCLK